MLKIVQCVILFFSYLSASELQNRAFELLQFVQEECLYGIKKESINLVCENGKFENIGFVMILSSQSISVFDSSIFESMDKTTLPPEVCEMLHVITMIKNELKTPLENIVILGALYIKPEFRSNGYAKLLIKEVCNSVFDSTKVDFIIVTPSPFEYESNMQKSLRNTPDYETKRESLIKLYSGLGFVSSQEDSIYMYIARPWSESSASK